MAHHAPGLTFPPYAEFDNRLPNRRMQRAKLCKTSKNDVAPLLAYKWLSPDVKAALYRNL
jgi:hypothetical protein